MKKYNNIDGLRTLSAIGIIFMHIQASIGYKVAGNFMSNYILDNLISSFGQFVSLFFMISGFGMCCGYYERIKHNTISLNSFYNKRYVKILPFFALLVLMDVTMTLIGGGEFAIETFYEAYADLTLMFGFLPASNITVIGVGWTLGVIFGFYILFPFFVYMIWTKRRAWFFLGITLILNALCIVHFLAGGDAVMCNTLRHLYAFVFGGVIYLYRDFIVKIFSNKYIALLASIVGLANVWFVKIPFDGSWAVVLRGTKNIFGFALLLASTLGEDAIIWSNPLTKFISKISLEIYLAQMMVFRVLEKLHMTKLFGETIASYIVSCLLTIVGVSAFAVIYQIVEKKVKSTFVRV